MPLPIHFFGPVPEPMRGRFEERWAAWVGWANSHGVDPLNPSRESVRDHIHEISELAVVADTVNALAMALKWRRAEWPVPTHLAGEAACQRERTAPQRDRRP